MRPTVRALTLLVTSALTFGALSAPAYAASPVIVTRTPAADSYQATRPSGVTIVFDQNVATSSTISVAGPMGASCTKNAPVLSPGTTLSCAFAAPTPTTVPDGTYTVNYTANSTGGDPATTGTYTFHVDATVPGDPTLASTNPTNGGSKKSASFTYVATANETLASSSKVDIFDDTLTQLGVTKVVSGSTVTVTPVDVLPQGAYTARVHLVDVSGRAPDFIERTFTIDNTAPAAPVITAPLGKINIANNTSFPVSGTGEAGAVVTLTSGAATATATVNGSSAWTANINVSALPDGPVSFTATQKDAADNVSGASAAQATTKDTVRPRVTAQGAAPALLNAAGTTATVSGKVDNGSTTAGEADPVSISADDAAAPGTAPVVVTTTAAGDGTFSTTLNTASLNDGTITYTFVATDDSGNPSTAVTATNTKDTVAPGAPTVSITPAPINAANQAAITVSGTAAGTTAFITVSDGPGGGADLTFNDTVGSGAYSNSFNVSTLLDGPITATVTSSDAAGNTGPTGSASTTKDTVAPGTPTIVVNPSPITAASAASVTISGSSNGDTVTITLSDGLGGGADITTTATVTSGGYSKVVDVTTLDDGDVDVEVVASDTAGNSGTAATVAVPKDTTVPGQPATLSGSPSPYISGSTTFTISGTSANADTLATGLVADITVSDTNTTTNDLVALGQSVTTGSFGATFSAGQMGTQVDGPLTVSAVIRDAAGNVSTARTASVTKNTTPLALVSSSPAANSTVGPPATISATYNETLNAMTSTITVKNKNNVTLAGSSSVSGATITFTPSSPLTSAGSAFKVNVHAVNAGDANDVEDSEVIFTVDSTPPAKPTITSVTDPVNNGNKTAVAVSGNAGEAGATVTVTLGGTVTGTTTSTAGGAYTVSGIDVTSLPDGSVSVTAASEDAYGNDSPVSDPASTTKDTVNPSKSSSSPMTGTTVAPPATVSITFDETLASGSIDIPGVVGTSAVVGSTATFTPAAPIPDGTYTATATVTDARGNAGSGATTFTVDGTGPSQTSAAPTTGSTVTPPATVSVAFSEPLGSGSITIPGVAGTSAVSGSTVTFTPAATIPDGSHTATASVTDAQGNPGTGTTTFTVDDALATSSTTFNTPPGIVTTGATVTLSGKVNRSDTSVAAGGVEIAVLDDAGSSGVVTTVTPANDGTWSVALKPTKNGRYTASYLGDAENSVSSSVERSVRVRVLITAKSKAGPATKRARVKGTVSPNKAGEKIRLYDATSGKLLATATVKPSGRYKFVLALPKGKTKLRVEMRDTSGNLGNQAKVTATRT